MDTYTFEQVGYAFINLDLKQFGQSFMVFTEDGSMDSLAVQGDYVIYQGQRVTDAMASHVRQALLERKESFAANKNQVMNLSFSGEDWRMVATYNEALDLTIVSMAAGRVLKLHMMQGMASYVIIVVIMTAVFIGVSILLSVKPVSYTHLDFFCTEYMGERRLTTTVLTMGSMSAISGGIIIIWKVW